MTKPLLPGYVTLTELGRRAGVTPASLRQLIARGRLPAFKVGTTWVVAGSDARAYIARKRKGQRHA